MGNLCPPASGPRPPRSNNVSQSKKPDTTAAHNKAKPVQYSNHEDSIVSYNSMVLGAENNISSTSTIEINSRVSSSAPTIVLLPHQHTLFCERKQRVCSAVGKAQELESLKVDGIESFKFDWVWFRCSISSIHSVKDKKGHATIIRGSENKASYQLGKEDVENYIGVCYAPIGCPINCVENKSGVHVVENSIGPILPGPPRIVEFVITGDIKVGGHAKAEISYIGGKEGQSEYWWMRITPDGKRSQITDPKAIPKVNSSDFGNPSKDPRYYLIRPEDIACTLKAKCRPKRVDNAEGEIFTSKSSNTIEA